MQNPCTWTSSVARFPFLLPPPPPSAHTTSFHHQHLLRGLGGGAAEHRAGGGCSLSSGTKPLQKMPRGGGGSPLAPSAASSCLRFLSVPETLNIFIFLFSFGNQARQTFFRHKPYATADKQVLEKRSHVWKLYFIDRFACLTNY